MSERDPIEYLLNAMENAAQSDAPAKHGYAEKRRAVLNAIADLRSDRDAAHSLLRQLLADIDRAAAPDLYERIEAVLWRDAP